MDHTGHQSAVMVRVYTRRADAFADHAGEGLLYAAPMRTLLSLIILAPMVGGCFLPIERLRTARAEKTREETALIRQYRECLQRAETDRNVDCSGYHTAVEINDARESK
jgi:hypothetical protein